MALQQLTIAEQEAGQRIDRLLQKVFQNASKGFLYKMFRKKNIVLNKKRVEGNEIVHIGDVITIYFSDETFLNLSLKEKETILPQNKTTKEEQQKKKIRIVYEDKHVLILHKPVGVLSQKAEKTDWSLVEFVTDYLISTGNLSQEKLLYFHPGICNRLDRNTEGLVVAGKTTLGLQTMSELFRNRTIEKYYLCVVLGNLHEPMKLCGYLTKDEAINHVFISSTQGKEYIETEYRPIAITPVGTVLEVGLITGKSHQIRAHLASIGHPIAGDTKYGNEIYNRQMKERFGIRSQLLIAFRMIFPTLPKELMGLSQKEIRIEEEFLPKALLQMNQAYHFLSQ